eukprot:1311063-Rhodomonas_salina.1
MHGINGECGGTRMGHALCSRCRCNASINGGVVVSYGCYALENRCRAPFDGGAAPDSGCQAPLVAARPTFVLALLS